MAERTLSGEVSKVQSYAHHLAAYGKRLPALLRQEDQRLIDQWNAEQPARQAKIFARSSQSFNARKAEEAKAAKSAREAAAKKQGAYAERDAVAFERLRDSLTGGAS